MMKRLLAMAATLTMALAFVVSAGSPVSAAGLTCTESSGVITCPGIIITVSPNPPVIGQPVTVTVTLPDGFTLPDGTVIPPGSTVQVTILVASTPRVIGGGPQQTGTTKSFTQTVPSDLAAGSHTLIVEINGQVVNNTPITLATAVTATPTPTSGNGLTLTGADVAGLVGFAVVLLGVGTFAVVVARRRRDATAV